MISRSQRDSVGGGVAEFVRHLQKPTTFGGEGRGVVAGIFRVLRKPAIFGGGGGY